MNKTMAQVANKILQKNINTLFERYDKAPEKAIFTFEEYARDIANTRNTFLAKVVSSVLIQYDNQTDTQYNDFKEYCEYFLALSEERAKVIKSK